jgi:hypothetical protein
MCQSNLPRVQELPVDSISYHEQICNLGQDLDKSLPLCYELWSIRERVLHQYVRSLSLTVHPSYANRRPLCKRNGALFLAMCDPHYM